MLALSFSVDKARIATGAADKQTRVWDVASGKELEFFAHDGAAGAVVLHPNNKDLVYGGRQGGHGGGAVGGPRRRRRTRPGPRPDADAEQRRTC